MLKKEIEEDLEFYRQYIEEKRESGSSVKDVKHAMDRVESLENRLEAGDFE